MASTRKKKKNTLEITRDSLLGTIPFKIFRAYDDAEEIGLEKN